MKKELGKWLMDIAKYVLTAVVVMSLVSLGFGRCPVADIRFGLADNSGMFGRRSDFSQG